MVTKFKNSKFQFSIFPYLSLFGMLNFGHYYLSFDFAQDGESLDMARDREFAERPVEPFVGWDVISVIFQSVHFRRSRPLRSFSRLSRLGGFFMMTEYGKKRTACQIE
jgi:hypothetical protein